MPSDRTFVIASISGIVMSEALAQGSGWEFIACPLPFAALTMATCCASSSSGLLVTYMLIVVLMSLWR